MRPRKKVEAWRGREGGREGGEENKRRTDFFA